MKNIIFDFGNVLITFHEQEIVSHFTNNPEEQKFIINNAIYSPEWVGYGLIDAGYISQEEAINLINDRTNNIHKDLINNFMNNYHKYMYIQEKLIEVIKTLKNKGYKIYMLSNTNEYMYENYIKKIEYLFDGLVLSYNVHMIKPYDSIYKYLINTYNLNPEESLFIDDKKENIDTANKFGIKGRPVNPNDIEDVLKVLNEYEVLK